MNQNRIFITIANAEGCRLKPYYCTEGALTIGYGRALERKGITQDEAEGMLRTDIADAEADAARLVQGFFDLTELRQEVIVEMVFQLGMRGVSKFVKTIRYIENGNYTLASFEMLDSRWAKQTPGRARRLAENMRNG